jgi:hypothetical protein
MLRIGLVAAWLGLGAVGAEAQSLLLRGGFVGFGTGDDINCPVGMGVAGGVEARTGGRLYAALGADLYVATPQVCTTVVRIVPYESGYADEFAGVTLLFAPRLTARFGVQLAAGTWAVEPSAAVGVVHAPELWGDGVRRALPYAGGALAVRPRGWRFGMLVEHGFQRVPITHQVREQDRWRTIHVYGTWKPLFNLGISVVP